MNFEFELKFLDGGEVPFGSRILVDPEYTAEDIVKLLPNESHQYEEEFDDCTYTMPNRAGKYEISGMYKNRTKSLGGIQFEIQNRIQLWTGEVKSNTERFNIYK
jgi:hypothetical protein